MHLIYEGKFLANVHVIHSKHYQRLKKKTTEY